jgi:hypothetical protein
MNNLKIKNMNNLKLLWRVPLLALLFWLCSIVNLNAQPDPNGGGTAGDVTFADAYEMLVNMGYADCLTGIDFTPEATAQDLFDYIAASGCQPTNGGGTPIDPNGGGWLPPDSIGCGGWAIQQEIEYLISIGLGECFDGAPEFASFDELYTFLSDCPAYVDYITWDINDELAWISTAYPDCLTDAPTFASIEELYAYLGENCEQWIDDMTWDVNDELEWLTMAYPDCFTDAPEFTTVEELYAYLNTCPSYIDAITWDINDELAWISTAYPDCLTDAPTFTSIEELYAYLGENCEQWIDDMTWDVNDELEWLTMAYPDCFTDAPEFATVEELYAYLNTCPSYIDAITWDINDELAWISTAYPDCLTDAPTFTSIEELYAYLGENCEQWIDDMTWDVNDELEWLSAAYPDCFTDAPEFATVEELYNYLIENCPAYNGGWIPNDSIIVCPVDTTGWGWGEPGNWGDWTIQNEIDYWTSVGLGECFDGAPEFTSFEELYTFLSNCPAYVEYTTWDINDEIAWLTEAGYGDCLAGIAFNSIEELYAYLGENCAPWIDDMTWDLDEAIEWVNSAGYGDCLIGAEFTSVEDLYAYLDANCEQWIDDMTWDVNDELEWLVSAGYGDCIPADMTFDSIEALYNYLYENCEAFAGGGNGTPFPVEVPDCLQTMPADIITVQGYLQYVANNCGTEFLAGIPPCYLDAPLFATDEEFFAWVNENCTEGLAPITDNESGIMQSYAMASNAAALANNANSTDNIAQIDMSLAPNPTSSFVQLQTNDPIAQYQIIDLSGRVLLSNSNVQAKQVNIALDQVAKGVYVLKVQTSNGKIGTQKLVVQ